MALMVDEHGNYSSNPASREQVDVEVGTLYALLAVAGLVPNDESLTLGFAAWVAETLNLARRLRANGHAPQATLRILQAAVLHKCFLKQDAILIHSGDEAAVQ